MRLDPRLRSFAAVVRQGSFSKAATELFVSQPAVSKHVAALESELGNQLVVRGRRGVTLTAAGRVLADYVLRAEALLANAVRALDAEDAESGTVVIAASGIPGDYLLPTFLPTFFERHPRIAVDVRLTTSEGALRLVSAHETELAVFGGFSAPADLEVAPLVRDDVVLVGAPRLAGRRLRPQDLARSRWISRGEGSATRAAVESARWQIGLSSVETLELPSWEAVKGTVAAGGGIAAISRYAIEHELASGALVLLDVPRWRLERTISLAVARDVPLTLAAARFRTALQEVELPVRNGKAHTGTHRRPRAKERTEPRSDDEELALTQLSVFAGGFERDAAEHVCDVPVDLDHLVERGKVRRDGRRFELAPRARARARKQLGASKRADDVRRRHAEFFASLVEESEPHLSRTGQEDWTQRLIRDRVNIDAAVEWAATHGERELQLRIMGSCWTFWLELGYSSTWHRRLEEALADVEEPRLRLLAVPTLAWRALERGDLNHAQALAEERLRLGREVAEDAHIAGGLTLLAEVAERGGDIPTARRVYEEALVVDRRPGSDERLVRHLINYAGLLVRSGELRSAGAAAAEAADVARVRGADALMAAALFQGALVAFLEGEPARALELAQEALERRTPEQPEPMWEPLELAGAALVESGRHRAGTKVLALADQLRTARGDERLEPLTSLRGRAIEIARAQLGAEAFRRAQSRGARLTIDDALAREINR